MWYVSVTHSDGTAYGAVGSFGSVDAGFAVAVVEKVDCLVGVVSLVFVYNGGEGGWGERTTRGTLPVRRRLRIEKAINVSPRERARYSSSAV